MSHPTQSAHVCTPRPERRHKPPTYGSLTAQLRSYRATLVPNGTDYDQIEVKASHGALPTIQLKARNASQAELAAHHVTGLHVLKVERMEGGSA